jgi:lysine 6-dehydrogenase
VLDYYTTKSWVVRDSKRQTVTALSERETVDFPAPVGQLEAFHTAGGLSTMAFRYEGRIPTMEYKTLRYPGHAEIMETIRALGLLDLEPVDVKGTKVVPRDVFVSVVGPKLNKPEGKDLLALRVTVSGIKDGKPAERRFDLIDRYDEKHGISAMMRTTGYSLSITGQMQARGQVRPAGVWTPDECMPAREYIDELRKRGMDLKES